MVFNAASEDEIKRWQDYWRERFLTEWDLKDVTSGIRILYRNLNLFSKELYENRSTLSDYIGWGQEHLLQLIVDVKPEATPENIFLPEFMAVAKKENTDCSVKLINVNLAPFPKLCGTLIYNNFSVPTKYYLRSIIPKFLKIPLATLYLEFLIDLAKCMKFGSIMASGIVSGLDFNYEDIPHLKKTVEDRKDSFSWQFGAKHELFRYNVRKAGFTAVANYLNPRSNNHIEIWHYDLTKDQDKKY
jgi:hypothetical protein